MILLPLVFKKDMSRTDIVSLWCDRVQLPYNKKTKKFTIKLPVLKEIGDMYHVLVDDTKVEYYKTFIRNTFHIHTTTQDLEKYSNLLQASIDELSKRTARE